MSCLVVCVFQRVVNVMFGCLCISEGSECHVWLSVYFRGWDELPPAHRMRPEGESIAVKNSSDSMFDIMRSDNGPAPCPTKESKQLPHMQESSSP